MRSTGAGGELAIGDRCRASVTEFTAQDPSKPRFVIGALGPTNKTTSLDLARRQSTRRGADITFDRAASWRIDEAAERAASRVVPTC